ncbi:MAG: hypothetical protein ACXAAI_00640 [Promethearchaeota archaeon]|jgi:hypothetical protein
MEKKARSDLEYYDFLFTVQQISQQSRSIQKKVIAKVFTHYDTCRFVDNLDRQIEHIDELLSI